MYTIDQYTNNIIKEVEQREDAFEFGREMRQQGISDILGTINLYAQVYITDSDLKSLGIKYEKI